MKKLLNLILLYTFVFITLNAIVVNSAVKNKNKLSVENEIDAAQENRLNRNRFHRSKNLNEYKLSKLQKNDANIENSKNLIENLKNVVVVHDKKRKIKNLTDVSDVSHVPIGMFLINDDGMMLTRCHIILVI